jgi:hypothetical protein
MRLQGMVQAVLIVQHLKIKLFGTLVNDSGIFNVLTGI